MIAWPGSPTDVSFSSFLLRCKSLNHTCVANTLNHSTGAFAEHILGKDSVALILPDNVSFESAASLGAGLTTIGLCLYKSLQLPLPTLEHQVSPLSGPVLVYGGSTATGVLAIQFLKL